MASKKSLERSWKFKGHHAGCACSDCWALTDLLDEAIREARLAEAKEWAAHRPGDGFYVRRIKELKQAQLREGKT